MERISKEIFAEKLMVVTVNNGFDGVVTFTNQAWKQENQYPEYAASMAILV